MPSSNHALPSSNRALPLDETGEPTTDVTNDEAWALWIELSRRYLSDILERSGFFTAKDEDDKDCIRAILDAFGTGLKGNTDLLRTIYGSSAFPGPTAYGLTDDPTPNYLPDGLVWNDL